MKKESKSILLFLYKDFLWDKHNYNTEKEL